MLAVLNFVMLKLLTKFPTKFLLQPAILVEFVIHATFAIFSILQAVSLALIFAKIAFEIRLHTVI